MTSFRADLHCHSTCSDGSQSPEEIINLAKKVGLSGLCITDHDTIDAYETALDYAVKANIEMISGVEFSCVHKGKSVHILGYAFSTKNKQIKAFCKMHEERRTQRYLSILELLHKADMSVLEEDLKKITSGPSIGRPHIALAMLKKGYVKTVDEAFKKYLGDDKPFYVKGEAFPVEETIDIIHKAGGVAIIAHPHLIKHASTVQEMLEMDFDGLEGYYAKFGKEVDLKWVNVAKNKNWIVTGGSDFHGNVKPHIQLGCSWVNRETFEILKEKFIAAQSM